MTCENLVALDVADPATHLRYREVNGRFFAGPTCAQARSSSSLLPYAI